MNASDLTVVIMTYNEERHIRRCIESVKKIAVEILVVDCYSTDSTVEVAAELGARVLQNEWVNHAVQFQWCLDNADITTPWIMRLDADEYLETSPEEFMQRLDGMDDDVTGFNIKRKMYFLGKWIKYGGLYPVYTLRIWRNGYGCMEQRWMDEHIVLTNGRSEKIEIDIVDDNKGTVSWWIDKHNNYATNEMIEVLNQKYEFMAIDNTLVSSVGTPARVKRLFKDKIYNKLPLFIRPLMFYIYRYILRLGILDGKKGFAFHYMQTYWYRTLVDLKVLEAEELLKHETDTNTIKEILAQHTGKKL